MKFTIDTGFEKRMNIVAKVSFYIGMAFIDLAMRLSGVEQK